MLVRKLMAIVSTMSKMHSSSSMAITMKMCPMVVSSVVPKTAEITISVATKHSSVSKTHRQVSTIIVSVLSISGLMSKNVTIVTSWLIVMTASDVSVFVAKNTVSSINNILKKNMS